MDGEHYNSEFNYGLCDDNAPSEVQYLNLHKGRNPHITEWFNE